jgi:excinuclease ABC subunit A
MSELDGVSACADLVKRAYEWGMPSIAITDHGVVQGFTYAFHTWTDLWDKEKGKRENAGDPDPDKQDFFKIIYGVEAYLVDDLKKIVNGDTNRTIDSQTYVVFDLETTGFSPVDDHIIEIGPAAGRHGGEIVYEGKPQKERFDYAIPQHRRKWNNYIELTNACENNLKDLNVKFPLGVLTVVTGVSGSGKSSLISKVLYPAMKKHYGGMAERTGNYGSLTGSLHLVKNIEFVDQNPLSRSSRSNPVTYLKAYDEIRRLFAEQPLAKQLGLTPAHFSFNTPGGRCEECEGEGTITIEMQFMADLTITCEQCHGKRFKQDILDVHYRGKSIYDVLTMTINQAIDFFGEDPDCKKIVQRLKPLQDVGIGYIQLGQSSSTLSGGESQRVKLASFLAQENQSATVFVFDEPTTGLHHKDIQVLLKALNALISNGHTVIVIEHNASVILAADHVIDLGPEGGEEGGYLVFEGTPEDLAQCEKSYTGKYIRELIK